MRHRGPTPTARHRTRPPEERSLNEARYVGSFPTADPALDPPLPEIALVGRSNVGKSSLVNALAGRTLAKVSTTPGKTRALNVYLLSGAWAGRARSVAALPAPPLPPLYLLDLPGYGYARASKTDRAAYRRLIAQALERPKLAGVLWLLDLRREPSADDRAVQQALASGATRVLAAMTKSDRLPRSRRGEREVALREALALDSDQVIVTSAHAGDGVAELREALAGLIEPA